MKKMSKTLTRQYFDIKDAKFAEHTSLENGVLSISFVTAARYVDTLIPMLRISVSYSIED